jgi:hypothetical protein
MGGSFEDILNHFFSGGGGGQQRTFEQGGGSHLQQLHQGDGRRQHLYYQEEDEDKNYFYNTDVINLKMNNLSKIYVRTQIWFVLFFKANDHEFESLKEMWKVLA